ncbi:hypothetical protein MCOR25_000470 [Pyricularia grisea]|uniref:Yeast cell wall synthesis Kre9/Knh1-like N-terminal domain-containing protein n=1 Tax=Pyricularia grisea TaxID=148305 RepID=A0A6P8AVT9_PYRGI|nr:uncharacterized protein PgNI_08816 [Pyricularia grisea]KAI6382963.1 hypothetical protein MCOR25_000470 [Pyricularia grisea]TLD06312.1 hypothetical protein PgNI_08816 [Pyricularia grisea]
MKFTLSACVAVLAAIVEARVQFTNSNFAIQADKPFELTWSGASGPVTIYLKDGPSTNLRTVETLASGLTGSSTTVTLKSSELQSGTYAFGIKDTSGDAENYSQQFNIVGTGAVSTTASGSTTAASSTASSSASSVTTASTLTTTARPTAANTTSTANSSSTAARTSATSTPASTTTSSPPNTGSGSQLQSSLALVFLGAAAYVFLN